MSRLVEEDVLARERYQERPEATGGAPVRPARRPASTIPVGALAQDQPGHFAPLLLGERRPDFLDRALSFAVPALLAALVVTGTVVERHDIVIDARLAGVAAAAIVALLRGPLLAFVAVAQS